MTNQLKQAYSEHEAAQSFFNYAEPEMVDSAIHMMIAAEYKIKAIREAMRNGQ